MTPSLGTIGRARRALCLSLGAPHHAVLGLLLVGVAPAAELATLARESLAEPAQLALVAVKVLESLAGVGAVGAARGRRVAHDAGAAWVRMDYFMFSEGQSGVSIFIAKKVQVHNYLSF